MAAAAQTMHRARSAAPARRPKGARRADLCEMLSDELGEAVGRSPRATKDGRAGPLALHGFAVTIKTAAGAHRATWWAQALQAGRIASAEPIVFYRVPDAGPWRALIRTADGGYRLASFDQAVLHIREKWARWP